MPKLFALRPLVRNLPDNTCEDCNIGNIIWPQNVPAASIKSSEKVDLHLVFPHIFCFVLGQEHHNSIYFYRQKKSNLHCLKSLPTLQFSILAKALSLLSNAPN